MPRRHKCFVTVDKELEKRNSLLSCNLFDSNQILIATDRIETGRGKPKAVSLIATYCPFCGEKLKFRETILGHPAKSKSKKA